MFAVFLTPFFKEVPKICRKHRWILKLLFIDRLLSSPITDLADNSKIAKGCLVFWNYLVLFLPDTVMLAMFKDSPTSRCSFMKSSNHFRPGDSLENFIPSLYFSISFTTEGTDPSLLMGKPFEEHTN